MENKMSNEILNTSNLIITVIGSLASIIGIPLTLILAADKFKIPVTLACATMTFSFFLYLFYRIANVNYIELGKVKEKQKNLDETLLKVFKFSENMNSQLALTAETINSKTIDHLFLQNKGDKTAYFIIVSNDNTMQRRFQLKISSDEIKNMEFSQQLLANVHAFNIIDTSRLQRIATKPFSEIEISVNRGLSIGVIAINCEKVINKDMVEVFFSIKDLDENIMVFDSTSYNIY